VEQEEKQQQQQQQQQQHKAKQCSKCNRMKPFEPQISLTLVKMKKKTVKHNQC